jgi:hypothetical protein
VKISLQAACVGEDEEQKKENENNPIEKIHWEFPMDFLYWIIRYWQENALMLRTKRNRKGKQKTHGKIECDAAGKWTPPC